MYRNGRRQQSIELTILFPSRNHQDNHLSPSHSTSKSKSTTTTYRTDDGRAAAVEQLEEWAERSGADIVVPLDADERPPSVVARAAEKAAAEGYDVLIVDTSG